MLKIEENQQIYFFLISILEEVESQRKILQTKFEAARDIYNILFKDESHD